MDNLVVRKYRRREVMAFTVLAADAELSSVPEDLRPEVEGWLAKLYGEAWRDELTPASDDQALVLEWEEGGDVLVPGYVGAWLTTWGDFDRIFAEEPAEDPVPSGFLDEDPAPAEEPEPAEDPVSPVGEDGHPAACPFGAEVCPHEVCPHGL